jgi:hypothetical protein
MDQDCLLVYLRGHIVHRRQRESCRLYHPFQLNRTDPQFGLEVNKYVVMSKFIKSAYETEPKISMGYVTLLPLCACVAADMVVQSYSLSSQPFSSGSDVAQLGS